MEGLCGVCEELVPMGHASLHIMIHMKCEGEFKRRLRESGANHDACEEHIEQITNWNNDLFAKIMKIFPNTDQLNESQVIRMKVLEAQIEHQRKTIKELREELAKYDTF